MKIIPEQQFLTEKEVAELTGPAVPTLRNDRHKSRGFPYHKIYGSVRYRLADILASMDKCRIDPEGRGAE